MLKNQIQRKTSKTEVRRVRFHVIAQCSYLGGRYTSTSREEELRGSR
jgi:hypothetical protein